MCSAPVAFPSISGALSATWSCMCIVYVFLVHHKGKTKIKIKTPVAFPRISGALSATWSCIAFIFVPFFLCAKNGSDARI